MGKGANENHQDRGGNDECGIIETALEYLIENGARGTPQALTGIGLAILAFADQIRQSNFIRSAEVFGFSESDSDDFIGDEEEL